MAETAIIVPVPEAESVVGRWRRRYTPSGASGMPAHITLLIPFIDSDVLDADASSRAKEVLARFARTELLLAAAAYFEGPPTVLYLQPEPDSHFREMTEALVQAFPDHPPYGDPDAQTVPHLTVATRLGREELAAIEGELAGKLPVRARPTEAWLMEHADQRWRLRDRIAFSAAA